MTKQISVSGAPVPVGAYSQAVVDDGGTVYVSGQLPIDPDRPGILAADLADQTRQALSNVSVILAGAGLTLADVVRVGVYLTDMTRFAAFNAAYAEFFGEAAPARSAIGVAALPHPAALIEIDAVARRRTA